MLSNICWLTRFYWLFRETHQLVGKHNISFLLLFGNSSHPRILPPHFWESSKLSQIRLRIILLYSKVSQPFLAEIESARMRHSFIRESKTGKGGWKGGTLGSVQKMLVGGKDYVGKARSKKASWRCSTIAVWMRTCKV